MAGYRKKWREIYNRHLGENPFGESLISFR
jgi:hypothetical protein